MGGASIWHWIVVGLIVVLLFGRGKISEMMGDVAKGIKAFKKGMSEDEAAAAGTTTTTDAGARPPGRSRCGPSSTSPAGHDRDRRSHDRPQGRLSRVRGASAARLTR